MGWSAILTMVAIGALTATAAAGEEGTIEFCANLSPDEESAPTYSSAVGLGRFTLRRSDLKLSWEISFKDLTGPAVAANIHGPQRPGANAQVLFPLVAGPIRSPLKGSITLDDGQLEYLLTGRMYANFTTEKYPDGELRAQLQRLRPGVGCTAEVKP
jgi:hypothetical protein